MTNKTDEIRNSSPALENLTLGKTVEYVQTYSPDLLQAVPRSLSRQAIGLTDKLPFSGEDIWNGYELSWLNLRGKPQVAIMQCIVPCDSPNLIESKSFKLYLNSFNQSKVESVEQLTQTLQSDLSNCAGKPVQIKVILPKDFAAQKIQEMAGQNIDDQDLEFTDYQLDASALKVTAKQVSETLYSNLLKSNCLITNQPDWGSIMIRYTGAQIDQESLLRYLISFRMHNEFHEQCVERIFRDIKHFCEPYKLTVYARYTRRGGLDINPFRSDFESAYSISRQARQ
ncbi:NADPH-dependent 7-cyano-7-deazaguanine reductase QueF [Aliiglaciecola sp. NS0011-25]|uniref:NADPH-dependent 7-cyano-7-deazaguanine reductase QueF n=1 Tax=Aliiglaciecola sp. NS0011-25 TaxID=3127654 RepID=UPI00310A5CCA